MRQNQASHHPSDPANRAMSQCTTCKYHVFGAMVPIPTGKPDEPPVITAMGWCYRYPPQVTGQGMSSSPPVKSETTWCGEWKLKAITKP